MTPLLRMMLVLFLTGSAAGAVNHVQTLEEARQQARDLDEPILIEVGVKGCGSCRRFERAVVSDSCIQRALSGLVLLTVDIAHGEGKQIQRDFQPRIFPTFLLVDANLDLIDRWFGFIDADAWIEVARDARSDLDPLTRKRELYERTPTRARAAALGRDAFLAGEPKPAVAYFRAAQALDPEHAHRYTFPIFFAMQDAMDRFTAEQLTAAADAVLANEHRRLMDVIRVAQSMVRLAKVLEQPKLMLPYIDRAIAESKGSGRWLVLKARQKLLKVRADALQGSG